MKTDTETKEIKNKVKIGEVEFTMPFHTEAEYIFDANDRSVAESNTWDVEDSEKERIAQTIATALNAHFARQWVSVKDGLPEKSGNYLVTYRMPSGDLEVAEGFFSGVWFFEDGGFEINDNVIAWQDARLPDAYEENE